MDLENTYAGFTDDKRRVYIGGPYYDDHAQIHLSAEDSKKLHAWLGRAIIYLEQRERG